MEREILEQETVPCGCILGTALEDGEPTFFIRPCSLTCATYAYFLKASREQDKPLVMRYES